MANAMKCDRCGKYYNENSNMELTNGLAAGVALADTDGDPLKLYDLCDDCLKEFGIFMDSSADDNLSLPALIGKTVISKMGSQVVMNTYDCRQNAQHVYDQLVEGRHK